MDLKLLFLISFQLILAINLTAGQVSRLPHAWVPINFPTPPPIAVPNFINCTQFSNSRDYWVTYTYNGVESRYCYLYPSYNTYATSWHQADLMCRYKNATLVSLHDQNTNYIISHPMRLRSGVTEIYWIGLNSLNGKRGLYKWSDGTPTNLDYYATTNSVNDTIPTNVKDQGRCVSMRVTAQSSYFRNYYKNTGQWFKDDCDMSHRYVCEKTSSPPPPRPTLPKGGCPTGWYNANQKCIKYFSQPQTFEQAKITCGQQTNGDHTGELLTIHSQNEQDFLTALTATGLNDPYIGLNRKNAISSWKWSDQSQFDYGNFGLQNNPTDSLRSKFCVILVTNMTQPGRWLYANCTEKRPFICEVYQDPSVSAGTNILTNKCNKPGFGNFIQYRQSCYSIVDNPSTKLTFIDAENHCKSIGTGGHLVSILDPYEEAFIRYYISSSGKDNMYLLGLQSKAQSDTNDTQLFEWSDGWPVYYTYWNYGEPKLPSTSQDQCVVQTFKNDYYMIRTWATVDCTTPYSYICKVTKALVPKTSSLTNGVCPKIIGNTDSSLDWVNLHKGSQYCYWFSSDRKYVAGSTSYQSWSDASFHCRRRNGTLVSIHSNHEVMILVGRLKKYDYFNGFWLGLSKNPTGELVWEDGSPVDFTNWAPEERFRNTSDLNDDSGNVCVELSWDMTWKQVACNGNQRNYFVCQTKKLFAPSQSQSQSSAGHGGRTAGIVIGVLLAFVAMIAIGMYVIRRSNLKLTAMPSFENPLSRSQSRTGVKPEQFHNNNPSSDLTQTANENPFANKSI